MKTADGYFLENAEIEMFKELLTSCCIEAERETPDIRRVWRGLCFMRGYIGMLTDREM